MVVLVVVVVEEDRSSRNYYFVFRAVGYETADLEMKTRKNVHRVLSSFDGD